MDEPDQDRGLRRMETLIALVLVLVAVEALFLGLIAAAGSGKATGVAFGAFVVLIAALALEASLDISDRLLNLIGSGLKRFSTSRHSSDGRSGATEGAAPPHYKDDHDPRCHLAALPASLSRRRPGRRLSLYLLLSMELSQSTRLA